jgi:hypothetical protein
VSAAAASASTYSPPSVAAARDTAWVGVKGTNNSLDFYWQAIDHAQWHEETV